ncbi:hypothetical protein V2J09_009952 [Rumex salicifolius]
MGSKLLPQALVTIPRQLLGCGSPKNPCFSTGFPRRFSAITAAKSLTSRVSDSRFGFNSDVKRSKQPFVVRAEADGEEAEPEVAGSVEESDAPAEAEAVDESSETEAESKPPSKPRVKMGDIMGILNKRAVEASVSARPVPDIRTGDIVQIKLEVPENRRRLSVYKGIVISRQNAGIHTTIRIRRIIAGIGVEIVFPLYSPNVKEIKVVSHRKVRKARLYYLRDKLPRLSTFK